MMSIQLTQQNKKLINWPFNKKIQLIIFKIKKQTNLWINHKMMPPYKMY